MEKIKVSEIKTIDTEIDVLTKEDIEEGMYVKYVYVSDSDVIRIHPELPTYGRVLGVKNSTIVIENLNREDEGYPYRLCRVKSLPRLSVYNIGIYYYLIKADRNDVIMEQL